MFLRQNPLKLESLMCLLPLQRTSKLQKPSKPHPIGTNPYKLIIDDRNNKFKPIHVLSNSKLHNITTSSSSSSTVAKSKGHKYSTNYNFEHFKNNVLECFNCDNFTSKQENHLLILWRNKQDSLIKVLLCRN